MKKVFILFYVLLLCFSAIACEQKIPNKPISSPETKDIVTTSKNNQENGMVTEKELGETLSAGSLEAFLNLQAKNDQMSTTVSLPSFVANDNLLFVDYNVSYVGHTKCYDFEGKLNGNETLDIYWHENDCTCFGDCRSFYLYILFMKNGLENTGFLNGYIQDTELSNLYTKNVINNQVNYMYVVNNYYYCMITVNRSSPDKDLIVSQLIQFCEDVDAAISQNNHTVVK